MESKYYLYFSFFLLLSIIALILILYLILKNKIEKKKREKIRAEELEKKKKEEIINQGRKDKIQKLWQELLSGKKEILSEHRPIFDYSKNKTSALLKIYGNDIYF